MDTLAFEAALKGDGYNDIARRDGAPNAKAEPHTHPFAVRGLVLAGEFILTREGKPERYRAGDTFAMEPGCVHFESFGPEGSHYILGRKHAAAANHG
ncbi:MAG: cupin domain-containing protein [Burkholderiales bacterium]